LSTQQHHQLQQQQQHLNLRKQKKSLFSEEELKKNGHPGLGRDVNSKPSIEKSLTTKS
jgi:hypothetical protein